MGVVGVGDGLGVASGGSVAGLWFDGLVAALVLPADVSGYADSGTPRLEHRGLIL